MAPRDDEDQELLVADPGGCEPGALCMVADPARGTAAGRVYAAYGGVYIAVALLWLWAVDWNRPTAWDIADVAVALTGMGIIMFQPR